MSEVNEIVVKIGANSRRGQVALARYNQVRQKGKKKQTLSMPEDYLDVS